MLRFLLNTTVEGRVPMVPNYRVLLNTGKKEYLGLIKDPTLGNEGGWRATGKVLEVKDTDPYFVEYILHIRQGDLLPLDEATARKVGGKCQVYVPPTPTLPGVDD